MPQNKNIRDLALAKHSHLEFIDVTPSVLALCQQPGYYILRGPHHSGKSLFLSAVHYYKSGKKGYFEGLRPEPAILATDREWEEVPVLFFDFKGYGSFAADDFADWLSAWLFDLQSLYARYPETEDLGGRLLHVARGAATITERKCALIIDDLDEPLSAKAPDPEGSKRVLTSFLKILPQLEPYVDFILFAVQEDADLSPLEELLKEFKTLRLPEPQ